MQKMFVHPDIADFVRALQKLEELDIAAQREYAHHHRRMVDIQHEIELSENYEDDLKCSVFEHMKDVATSRRKAKDTVALLDSLKKRLQSGTDLCNLASLINDVETSWDRHYYPRSEKTLDFSSSENLKCSRKKLNQLREK